MKSTKANPARARGRPTAYRSEFVEQVAKLARLGAIMSEIADFLDVEERTVRRWRHQYPEFDRAIAIGNEAANRRVEASLYQQALGYWIDDEEIRIIRGDIVRVKKKTYIPPSVTAGIYWSKARMGWRENEPPAPEVAPAATQHSDRDIARRIAFLLFKADFENEPKP